MLQMQAGGRGDETTAVHRCESTGFVELAKAAAKDLDLDLDFRFCTVTVFYFNIDWL
jgi:hypothetical protein